jgi:hypothetical protein
MGEGKDLGFGLGTGKVLIFIIFFFLHLLLRPGSSIDVQSAVVEGYEVMTMMSSVVVVSIQLHLVQRTTHG